MHHVCERFDAESMIESDWMSIVSFKAKVSNMQKVGVKFISLQDAFMHIKSDFVRSRKYAVITFDDGYASLKEILPWLEEQHIPATLFVNGKYLDGKSYRKNPKEKYLTNNELWGITSPLIEIGSHGWEHTDASKMSIEEFKQSIDQNVALLHTHPRYVLFHAYTWGNHTKATDVSLQVRNIVPVCIDGLNNYADHRIIHRELL